MHDEANAATEPAPAEPALPALPDDDAVDPEERVFVDDADELEVEIGDLVTYAPASSLDQPVRVRLTPRLTNPNLGLVAETTPLGSVLLGATVGYTVVLRVPGMAPQPFVIQAIKRSAEGAAG
jgi:transcription elongation GreA/GreB family factor